MSKSETGRGPTGWRGVCGALVVAVAAVLGSAGPARAEAPAGKSAYEGLDEDALAKRLKQLNMTELLEAMKGAAGAMGDFDALANQAEAKIAQALQTTNQAARDRLLDETIAVYDRLIEATVKAADDRARFAHYQFTLQRVITEGLTKCDPYVERMQYFLDRPGDADAVEKFTRAALDRLTRLLTRMEMTREEWGPDPERMITGVVYRLEEAILVARYRGAWLRFYRGLSLPAGNEERTILLNQCITDVKDFANAPDNSSQVKFSSLLLSGMAARELGQHDRAREFLRATLDAIVVLKDGSAVVGEVAQAAGGLTVKTAAGVNNIAADKVERIDAAEKPAQVKALFEIARSYVDEKKYAEADTAVKDFVARGGAWMGKGAEDKIAMQEMLLRTRLLNAQAEAVKASDPARSGQLRSQAGKVLDEFGQKYPTLAQALIQQRIGQYVDMPLAQVPPDMLAELGVFLFQRGLTKERLPAANAKDLDAAAKTFQHVLDMPKPPAEATPKALWHLGLIYNLKRDNLSAAGYWVRLAKEFPTDHQARNAALNAVKSYQGVLRQNYGGDLSKVDPKTFLPGYTEAMEVLVGGWGRSDKEAMSYNFELGFLYDYLEQHDKAIEAFSHVDPESPEYMYAGFRIVYLKTDKLLKVQMNDDMKRRQARQLVDDLAAYRDKAVRFAEAASDAKRKAQVRGWAAECDLLAPQLRRDVLDQGSQAVDDLKALGNRWDDVSDFDRRRKIFIAMELFREGKVTEAIDTLTGLEGVEGVIAPMMYKLREQIEIRRYAIEPHEVEKRKVLEKTFRTAAVRLYESAVQRKLPAEKMYGYKQVLAAAYESGSAEEVKQALAIYEELSRANPKDAGNVWGLARCYQQTGRGPEAARQYEKLIVGLKEVSPAWWRAELEQLLFAVEIYADKPDILKRVGLQVKLLRHRDPGFGTYERQFNALEDRVRKMVKE